MRDRENETPRCWIAIAVSTIYLGLFTVAFFREDYLHHKLPWRSELTVDLFLLAAMLHALWFSVRETFFVLHDLLFLGHLYLNRDMQISRKARDFRRQFLPSTSPFGVALHVLTVPIRYVSYVESSVFALTADLSREEIVVAASVLMPFWLVGWAPRFLIIICVEVVRDLRQLMGTGIDLLHHLSYTPYPKLAYRSMKIFMKYGVLILGYDLSCRSTIGKWQYTYITVPVFGISQWCRLHASFTYPLGHLFLTATTQAGLGLLISRVEHELTEDRIRRQRGERYMFFWNIVRDQLREYYAQFQDSPFTNIARDVDSSVHGEPVPTMAEQVNPELSHFLNIPPPPDNHWVFSKVISFTPALRGHSKMTKTLLDVGVIFAT